MCEASLEERVALAALRKLILLGFIGIAIGSVDCGPDVLCYARVNMDVEDVVRVYGHDEAEAVRLVGKRVVQEVAGTVEQVVDSISGWPQFLTGTGRPV